jgi:Ca2+/Na+ antiporter
VNEALYAFFNQLAKPSLFFLLFTAIVLVMIWQRKLVSTRRAGLFMLVASIVFFLWALQHPGFHKNVSKADNVPIVFMLFLVGFFAWLSFYRAVKNDQRLAQGGLPEEAVESPKKVLTWPDLIYSEFVISVLFMALMLIWGMALDAPLEEPANPNKTPNPSKAPWYFLGLQEMLVYYDPWLAGVVLPGLIIVGLMAIPYIDTNPKGNGYYTFEERPFAITTFFFGFIVLWVSMIILMTFLRGPNQAFFGPFEEWNLHKVEPTVNVQFSQIFWEHWLKTELPGHWFLRELPGILVVLGYLFVLPLVLAKTVFRKMYAQMGIERYVTMVALLLIMLALPIKMILRWTANLQYIVNIQDYFLNI